MNTIYQVQAEKFLSNTGTNLEIEFLKHDFYFNDDRKRDIYQCTLKNKSHSFSFTFGDSIVNSRENKKPNAYDILTCLEKYPVDTFEDFCNDFGYDEDSRKAYKIYKVCKNQYENICKLFTDEEMELLQEIQ